VKVLDITEYHSPMGGGVTTYLQAKARWLAARSDVEHVIVLSAAKSATEQWHRSRVYVLAGPPVPASPGFYFLLHPGQLRAIVRRERPDVIELGSPFLAHWLTRYAVRGMHPALVAYLHDDMEAVWVDHGLAGSAPLIRRMGRALVGSYVRAVHGYVAHTIAPTPAGARALSRLGIHDVTVIPLGVDLEQFHPRRRDPAWRREVGVEDDTAVALYVGRLAREKELALLVAALPRLSAELKVKVVMIGEGHMRAALEALARARPDRVAVLAFEPDRARLARAYASADCFINPCPYETFGLATLEAMASGIPVVAAAAGASGELLRGGGGITFDAGKEGDLVRAVGEALAADRVALGTEARRAAEALSWDRAFAQQLELYRRLVNGAERSAADRAAPAGR
jgi:alpha-1,6-mannosyltransferase